MDSVDFEYENSTVITCSGSIVANEGISEIRFPVFGSVVTLLKKVKKKFCFEF